MHEHVITLQVPPGETLFLWFEPWAEGLGFKGHAQVELRGASPTDGRLETAERTAVYGWAGSTLQVIVDGAVVLSFDQPVPSGMSREMLTLLFGAPPAPTPEEKKAFHKPG